MLLAPPGVETGGEWPLVAEVVEAEVGGARTGDGDLLGGELAVILRACSAASLAACCSSLAGLADRRLSPCVGVGDL